MASPSDSNQGRQSPTPTAMASPSVSDQERQSPKSNGDGESSQDSALDLKIKDEPADLGYEPPAPAENHSNSNSRTSSPPPSVQREVASPSQDTDGPTSPQSSDQQMPLNDAYTGSTIRSHLHGSSNTGKKVDSVQNIVEGLLKKNATLLAMSDTESLKPNSRRKGPENNIRRGEGSHNAVGQSTIFPVSMVSQARLVASQGNSDKKRSDASRSRLLRPKSPTRKCDTVLRDDTQLSYALMEADVGDQEVENVFRVQHHELVCAVSLKPYITDKDSVVAVLDKSFYWCNFCSFSSTNKELLTQHLMDHRFRCNHCPYESFCRSDILRHMAASHTEFSSSAHSLSYCTFLSDYLRVKSRSERLEKKMSCLDPDEDVDDLDKDEMEAAVLKAEKRKKENDGEMTRVPEKRARLEDTIKSLESSDSAHADRQGKSRKSLNPRRHPQPSENDYDTFEMEVEEINDFAENGSEDGDKMKVMYPSHMAEDSAEHDKPPPTSVVSRMQVVPSLQEGGKQGFTTTHISSPVSASPRGRPTKAPCPFNKTKRTSGSSSLYWSCGYCDFQSNSQAEIKEHSNRNHPGNPHRFDEVTNKKHKMANEEKDSGYHENSSVDADENFVVGNAQHLDDGNSGAHPDVNIVCKERDDHVHDSSALNLSDCLCKDTCTREDCRFDEGLNGVQEHPLENSSGVGLGSDIERVSATVGKRQSKSKEVNKSQIQSGKSREHEVEHSSEMEDGSHDAEESCARTCLGHTGSHLEIDKCRTLGSVTVETCENEGLSENGSKEPDAKCCEGLSSPSLKLTFKTVGQITTCSIHDTGGSKNVSNQQPSQQDITSSVSKDKANEWETYLMDSSDDSDLDMCSNPRSTALSVSSVSDLFENPVCSPCKDVVPEPGAEVECQSDFYQGEEKKVKPTAIFNENLIKLSSACEGIVSKDEKVGLSCVPARSAAVKAMTKMKPDVEKDVDLDDIEDDRAGICTGSKKHVAKSKQSLIKASPFIPEESSFRNHPKDLTKPSYSCHHCNETKAVTLQKIRSHLMNHHPQQAPIVTHVRQQGNSVKKRRLYICLLSSCKKLFKSAIDLDSHKGEHHNISLPTKPKERKTMNSLSTSSVSSIAQVLPPPVSMMHNGTENIPITDCCVKLRYLDTAQLSRYCGTPSGEKNEVGKYECLYCTESISCDTLSEIKQHYFSEHPSQLLVLRDVEAKRSQLPSRIYVCDDTGCDFQSTCRSEIMAHSGCHNTNCTCVYECPSCGWYSSSYGVAEDHVKEVHADEENISLVRMQLSVDENGQTSKRVLR